MSDAILGGVVVPEVYVQETTRQWIGGAVRRAILGHPHTNPRRRIRTWSIETRGMPKELWDALETMYDAHGDGQVLWVTGEGHAPTYVYILEMPDSRSMVPDGGTNSMRSTRIVLEEA